jgi:hypothetical protein
MDSKGSYSEEHLVGRGAALTLAALCLSTMPLRGTSSAHMFFTPLSSVPRSFSSNRVQRPTMWQQGSNRQATSLCWSRASYSYVVIKCEGVEFNIHLTIICSQSTMLERAANGYFKVSFRLGRPLFALTAQALRSKRGMNQDGRGLSHLEPAFLSQVQSTEYTNDYHPAKARSQNSSESQSQPLTAAKQATKAVSG